MADYRKKTEDGKEVLYEVNSWTGQEKRIGEIKDGPWGYRGISWGPGNQNEITEEPHERNSESRATINGREGTFKAEWKSGYKFEPDEKEDYSSGGRDYNYRDNPKPTNPLSKHGFSDQRWAALSESDKNRLSRNIEEEQGNKGTGTLEKIVKGAVVLGAVAVGVYLLSEMLSTGAGPSKDKEESKNSK